MQLNIQEQQLALRFNEKGLIPAVLQDAVTGEVLMVAYMNREAWEKTVETGEAWFYSRSRKELWHKGATSGHIQRVRAIYADCDQDTLLLKVDSKGPACHTGARSCFFTSLTIVEEKITSCEDSCDVAASVDENDDMAVGVRRATQALPSNDILQSLYAEICERAQTADEKSYTAYLLREGTDKICKKIGEEAAEVIIAAKNRNSLELTNEVCDLLYHVMVALKNGGVSWTQILSELAARSQVRGNKKEVGHLDKTF